VSKAFEFNEDLTSQVSDSSSGYYYTLVDGNWKFVTTGKKYTNNFIPMETWIIKDNEGNLKELFIFSRACYNSNEVEKYSKEGVIYLFDAPDIYRVINYSTSRTVLSIWKSTNPKVQINYSNICHEMDHNISFHQLKKNIWGTMGIDETKISVMEIDENCFE
jgi:hypothetical protein